MWSLAIRLQLWRNRVIENSHWGSPQSPQPPAFVWIYIYSIGLLSWNGEWAVDCERGWDLLTSSIPSGASEQKTGKLLGTLTIIKGRRKLSWKRSVIPSRTEQPFPFAPLLACWGDPAVSSLAQLLYLAPQALWTLPGKTFRYVWRSWAHMSLSLVLLCTLGGWAVRLAAF